MIVGVEEHRSLLRNEIAERIASVRVPTCDSPNCMTTIPTLNLSRGRLVPQPAQQWPPRPGSQPIRGILKIVLGMGSIHNDRAFCSRHGGSAPLLIQKAQLQKFCQDINVLATGLCLKCARADKPQSQCEHIEDLKTEQMVDPIVWE